MPTNKHIHLHFWSVLAIVFVVVLSLARSVSPTLAATTTVSANFSTNNGAPTHSGAGFLYGLNQDGSGPADSWLQPLKITSMRGGGARLPGHGWIGDGYTAGAGYQARINSAIAQARRVTTGSYSAVYDLIVSDVYGLDTEQPANTIYPCDNGNCSNYLSFITRLVTDINASGVHVSFDIMNEPDGTGFWPRGVNSAQYYQMWNTAVREIRRLKPGAWIVGPSYSGFNSTWLAAFLDRVKADGTVPEVVNWHFSGNVVGDANTVSGFLSSRGITAQMTMNEYIFSGEQNSGYTAWYLTQLSKSGIKRAAHAIWTSCCMDGTLDQILVNSGGIQPTGRWWVYRRYGDLSGIAVASTGGGGVDLAGAHDSVSRKATILLGSNNGFTGTATVNLTGLGSTPYLVVGGQVWVTVERIPNTGTSPLAAPQIVQNNAVTVSNNQVTVSIPWNNGLDAYAIILTPPGSQPPTNTPAPTPTNGQYEAENGSWGGGATVMTDHPGYSGTGFVAQIIAQGAYSSFTVTAPSTGSYPVTLRYSAGPNGPASDRTLHIYVNGGMVKQTVLPRTTNWDTWATKAETLTLTAGSNTIRYQFDAGDTGYINSDRINVGSSGATPTFAPPANVVQNPGFETAGTGGATDAANWTEGTNMTHASDRFHTGGWSLKSTYTGGGTSTNQTVTVTTNRSYTYSGWVWKASTTGGGCMDMNDIAGETQLCPGSTGSWVFLTGTWNSGSNTSVTLRLIADGTPNGNIWWDDISLQ